MQQVLQNPAIMQAFMQALSTAPRPNPPPPPPPDPYALIGTYARRAGIDPRQAIEVLAQAAAERARADAADEDAESAAELDREA
jgi:predicted RNA polymerase sigma factor